VHRLGYQLIPAPFRENKRLMWRIGFRALVVGCILGASVSADAQYPACLDYSDFLHVAAIIDASTLFSGPVEVTVSPDRTRAYVAGFPSMIHVVDISDPIHPSILGSVATTLPARAVAGNDNLVVVLEDSLLQVIDVVDSQTPSIVGSVPLGFSGARLTLSGSIAYVAGGTAGLTLVDLLVPSAPRLAGRVDTVSAWDVSVRGEYAYLAGGDLYVVDVKDPEAPAVVGDLPSGQIYTVTAQDSRAYVLV